MDDMNQPEGGQEEDQPKIFGVYINNENQVKFTRRKFVRSAMVLGTTAALSSCIRPSMTKEEIVQALEKTLAAKQAAGEVDQNIIENGKPTSTNTLQPTSTNTKKPEPTETLTATLEPTETESTNPVGEVTHSHNIFKGPHVDHPVITKTVVGEEVQILGRTSDGGWFKIIDSEGNRGWVFAEFIEVIGTVSIPVITNIPTQVPPICECDAYSPCTCDNYEEPASCGCDKHGCSCDVIHYWYPD